MLTNSSFLPSFKTSETEELLSAFFLQIFSLIASWGCSNSEQRAEQRAGKADWSTPMEQTPQLKLITGKKKKKVLAPFVLCSTT